MSVERRTVTQAGVTLTVVYEVADTEEIKRVIWSPGGPGDTDLLARANGVADLAVAGAPKRSGTLAKSIRVQQARTITGQFDSGYEVVATAPYALYVMKGTKPHPIEGRPLLVFDWPAGGLHPAVFRRVNHPGTAANPWFADSVRAAV